MSAHGVRYPAKMIVAARELRGMGLAYRAVRKNLISEFGVAPWDTTIARWCDDECAARSLSANRDRARAAKARGASFALVPQASPEYRAAFMRRLRQERMSMAAIAKVHGIVFAQPISPYEVERIVKEQAA